jgi:hypothetical protein
MSLRLLTILLGQDDFRVVHQHQRSTIVVDVSPVGTVDFRMSKEAKRLLENRGRLAARQFANRRGWELPEDHAKAMEEITQLENQIRLDVKAVLAQQRAKTVRKRVLGALFLGVLAVVLWRFGFSR